MTQARALRFETFLSNGRPTAAKVELWIPLLEARVAPPVSRSFPNGDLEETVIELTRSGCFGTCPTYSVTINGKGEVLWRGDANVAVGGEARDRVDPKVVAALLDRARGAGFFDLRDRYAADVTDSATYTVSITHGGRTKRVEDYVGTAAGMPYEVRQLEQAIDRAARTSRWVGPERRPS